MFEIISDVLVNMKPQQEQKIRYSYRARKVFSLSQFIFFYLRRHFKHTISYFY